MPKINNTNVTMTDEGYRNSYKRALEKNRKNATSRPRNIDYPSSRTRHPVSGTVAPIEKGVPVSNMYQHGNNFNLGQNVADNERHAHINDAFYAMGIGNKNWDDPYAYRKSARKKK